MTDGPFANWMPIDERRPSPNTGPGMGDAEYRRLVHRGGKQTWTRDDEERLKAKVRRIRGCACDWEYLMLGEGHEPGCSR